MFKRGKSTVTIGLLVVGASLLLAACGSQAPVTQAALPTPAAKVAVTPAATPTKAPTKLPTKEPTKAPTAMPTAIPAPASEVQVADQKVVDNTVVISKVIAAADGWIVIHADDYGKPGAILGETAVKKGENDNVKVTLAASGQTPVLYAMLHIDAGKIGTFEFPGADEPVKDASGNPVMASFKLLK